MSLTVCVPRFSASYVREDEHRKAAWEQCSRYWNRNGFEVVCQPGESRAAARNACAALVPPSQDVILFADADTVVPVHQMHEAAELARSADSFVLAYSVLYRALRNHPPLDDLLARPRGYRTSDTSNGAIAVSRALWNEVGGFDSRFGSWGGEDRSFLFACITLREQDEALRIPGHAVHLWHPPDRTATRPTLAYRQNVGMALRYKAAAGVEERSGPLRRLPGAVRNRGVMEALLREPGGPRSNAISADVAVDSGAFMG